MEWQTHIGLLRYEDALARMAERVASIQRGEADELAWLVEHPPLYTLGTSAKEGDVLVPSPLGGGLGRGHSEHCAELRPPPNLPPMGGGIIPTYRSGRGGQVTYHGPGQRVLYLMRDLKKHAAARGEEPDLRAYVKQLEQWIILTLRDFGVEGFTRDGRVGVWVETPTGEAKIAALGVRVQKWVTSHGIALNVNPDLSHYAGIVPCGIREYGVTSLAALGVDATMDDVDAALRANFGRVFG